MALEILWQNDKYVIIGERPTKENTCFRFISLQTWNHDVIGQKYLSRFEWPHENSHENRSEKSREITDFLSEVVKSFDATLPITASEPDE